MIDTLLSPNVSRMEILKHKRAPFNDLRTIHISVYRNHAFEGMEDILQIFLQCSGLRGEFAYSNYDDSFHFSTLYEANDLNLIWIDFSHYSETNWFKNKVAQLREISSKPILVYYTGVENLDAHTEHTIYVGSQEIERELGSKFLDIEKLEYSGTRLSAKALIKIAQQLGLKYIPSFFRTPIKAVMVDMDHTLYAGVLGEDGPEAVIPNTAFQKQLKALKDRGVLLGLASKNDYEDAHRLFDLRKDFVLRWEDFSCHYISWQSPLDRSIALSTDGIHLPSPTRNVCLRAHADNARTIAGKVHWPEAACRCGLHS